MKKLMLLLFGLAAMPCMGAMIHEYPETTTPALTDFTLLDSWNGATGAYNSARLSAIRTAMFVSPTFTGSMTVAGLISTNEFGGVNVITNINGTTIPTPFTFGGVSAADVTNTVVYFLTDATNQLGTAAFEDTTAFDAAGTALNATNGLWTATDARVVGATNHIQGFHYGTNQGTLNINLAAGEWFGLSTNDNFALGVLSGVSTFGTNVQKFSMIITNTSGATKTMTLHDSFLRADGATCFITNQGFLTGVVYPGLGTNAAYKCLK